METVTTHVQEFHELSIKDPGWKDPLEEEMATQYPCLGNPMDRGAWWAKFSSIQSLSCVQLFMTPWMDCSMPGFPVLYHLMKLAQIHVHWLGDAIQPSHPLSSPSPPTFNLSQDQGLFKWVSSSHQVAKVLEFQLKHQSFQWIFRINFPKDWLIWPPCCPRDTQESSLTPQFKSTSSSALSFLYDLPLTPIHDCWKNHSFDWTDLCWQSNVSAFSYAVYVVIIIIIQ